MLLSNSLTKLSNEDSAKLPALCAPISYVLRVIFCLTYSSAPRASRKSCPACFRASCFMCSHASCSTCSPSHNAFVPYVPYEPRVPRTSFSTCSCDSRVSYSMWPHALCFMSFFLRTLLFRTLHSLCANITFFALEFPCITFLFFCSFATKEKTLFIIRHQNYVTSI